MHANQFHFRFFFSFFSVDLQTNWIIYIQIISRPPHYFSLIIFTAVAKHTILDGVVSGCMSSSILFAPYPLNRYFNCNNNFVKNMNENAERRELDLLSKLQPASGQDEKKKQNSIIKFFLSDDTPEWVVSNLKITQKKNTKPKFYAFLARQMRW